jgi:uncharacterized protein YjdB
MYLPHIFSLLLVATITLTFTPVKAQSVCNGGFENGLTDWSSFTNGGTTTFSFETNDVQEGTQSLKVAVTLADSWRNRLESCDIGLVAGHAYQVSFYAKSVTGASGDIKFLMKDAGTNSTIRTDQFTINNTQWTQYSFTFVSAANQTVYERISFTHVTEYLIDNIVLEDISYFDCNGDLNGTAYIDNCDQCVGGNTGSESNCTTVILSGSPRTFDDVYFGLNTKNIGDNNFRKDMNIIESWKKMSAKIYRYPGGTFGNSFDWHTGTTLVGARPPKVDPPVTPAELVAALPNDSEILWMVNVRLPTFATGYDWRTLTRAELLSEAVLNAKIEDILEGLAEFESLGRPVKYLELGNEFYFSDDEGLGEMHGAIGDGGDGQGDHFPYDNNPAVYIHQMGKIAKAVKVSYPNIEIAVIRWKTEAGNSAGWNTTVNDSITLQPEIGNYIDAVTNHWYQPDIWYDTQSAVMPLITDTESAKTAMGFAFDYIDHKKAYDIPQTPTGKELWITEGDIKDPSDEGTWLEGVREGIIQLAYVQQPTITMNTPHMFQPNYVAADLKLTAKGKVASMIYAAGDGMTTVEGVKLGGNMFTGQFGGPYPELTGAKFSDGINDRFVLINVSANTYTGLDLSSITSATGLKAFQRTTTTAWSADAPTDEITDFVSSSATLKPYSVTIIADEAIVNDLIEYEFIVRDPAALFPNNLIRKYDFGYLESGSQTVTLEVKNDSPATVTLANNPLSLASGVDFSITQPSNLTLATGATTSFDVTFTPISTGDIADVLNVTTTDGRVLKVKLVGQTVGGTTNTAPVITSVATASVMENQTAAITVTATDADAGDVVTFSLSGGTDAYLFVIDTASGVLTFISAPDYEAPADGDNNNDYVVKVTATDEGSLTDVQIITITVTDDTSDNARAVTGVSVSTTTVSLSPADIKQLTATISPIDATNQNVTWSTDNAAVARVDANGLVTAVADGTANISVTTEDGGFTASCAVYVTTPPPPAPGNFNLLTPTDEERHSLLYPTYTWESSSDAVTYHIIVDNNADFSSPVIDRSGLYATIYTAQSGEEMQNNITYNWKVIAVNSTGSTECNDVFTNTFISGTSATESKANLTNRKIYPNPVQGVLNIEVNNGITQVQIHDISGKVVFMSDNNVGTSLNVDVSYLNHGVYFLQITDKKNEVSMLKIIKN